MPQPIEGYKLINFASQIEPGTLEQAKQTARMPFIHPFMALMPDAHQGMGAAVGTVIPTEKAIIPAAVGVDIGCGMIAAKTVLTAADVMRNPRSLHDLREAVEEVIPMSPGNYNQHTDQFEFTPTRIEALEALADQSDIDLDQHSPKWREQLGSLGGGNHFIELCRDEDAQVWMFLHSGSRGVGNKIAQKHIKIAKRLCKMWHVPLPNDDLAFLPQGTPEFSQYIKELRWAQAFALANREEMMDRFRRVLSEWIGFEAAEQDIEVERVNCHHNYTQVEQHGGRRVWVTRKGAIEASEGKMGLIPGSMGTRSYVVQGKGYPASLNSAPHGAGRRFSRTEARRRFTAQDLATRMEGIEYRPGQQWVDEIPDAYKDIDVVITDAQPLVEVKHVLSQIMNIKGE